MAPRILRRAAAAAMAILIPVSSFGAEPEEALSDMFKHVWQDQKLMITSPLRLNRVDFLVWSTAAGSIFYLAPRWGLRQSADERFDHGLERENNNVGGFLRGFTHVGDAEVLIGITLTSYGVGRWQDWPRVRTGSLHGLEGLLDAGIAAEVVKMVAGRRRPVDNPSEGPFFGPRGYFSHYSDDSSFVSGHATMTFALATIVSHESRSYWVGVPAYLVAGGISYSRIYVERHWLSDVIGGAALGYSVGILVEHNRHSKPQLADSFFYPMIQDNSVGLAWMKKF